jgi:hypothetical protein
MLNRKGLQKGISASPCSEGRVYCTLHFLQCEEHHGSRDKGNSAPR